MNAREITIPLYDHYKLAAKHWPNPKGIPLLALHGWLDNAASFDFLAPLLPEYDIVALDFPGHGHSQHKPLESVFHIYDLVVDSFLAAKHLGWDHFAVLGHSLGACVASLMAGTLPHAIQHAIVLDALGPLTMPADKAPLQLQMFMENLLKKGHSHPKVYPTLESAIQARGQASIMSPQGLEALVSRGTKPVDGGITWRTDSRLLRPLASQLTEEQGLAFLKNITAPVLLIKPEPGFPFPASILEHRIAQVKNITVEKISGNHHVHLDEPDNIATFIHRFLKTIP